MSVKALIIVLVTCFLAPSCNRAVKPSVSTDGWSTFEKTNFSIMLPSTFEEIPVQGSDTSVYQFANSESTITIEYGLYAKVPDVLQNYDNFKQEKVSLGWHDARLISYSSNDESEEIKQIIILALENINFSSSSILVEAQFADESEKETVLSILGALKVK